MRIRVRVRVRVRLYVGWVEAMREEREGEKEQRATQLKLLRPPFR